MALILNIETSTEVCSAALSFEGNLIALKENTEGQQHASALTVFIQDLFLQSGHSMNELKAVAVSKGPGSYTGLRIGVSVAKGIAYAAEIPLIAVSTLQALSFGVIKSHAWEIIENTWLCPMIDARRMEVYTAFFTSRNEMVKDIAAEIIDENSFLEILDTRQVLFFGNGALKCREKMTHSNAKFLEKVNCSAAHMIGLSYELYTRKEFVDAAYFEPLYLKDFIATVPKNLI
ncbi:MAG: tRNA (adenosine(37)-N6)-threonylcarbamoyltransferase complex dimerization subunit type 1 TsaB [Bacteroidales bacterium]